MSSPAQKRGGCGHVMMSFDCHSFFARCRDEGKGKDPFVEKPDTTDFKFCNSEDQRIQLATPSYKLKKELRSWKLPQLPVKAVLLLLIRPLYLL